MKKKMLIFLSFLAIFILTSCSVINTNTALLKNPPSDDTIRIGVFQPLSGTDEEGGVYTLEGIQLAHSMYPTVLGREVELFIEDNKGERAETSNAVSKLIAKDKVIALIGSYGSANSIAAGEIVKESEIPTIGCSPTSPLVTKDNPYYFRVCFTDPVQGKAMALFATEDLRAKKAAIVTDSESEYSTGLSEYFQSAFVKNTGSEESIVSLTKYSTGEQDFSLQLKNIQSNNPDVIFLPGNAADSARFITQAKNFGLTATFLGVDTWESSAISHIERENIGDIYFSSHFSVETSRNEQAKDFISKYRQAYEREPHAYSALGYDAYMLLIQSIKNAPSSNPEDIQKVLSETKNYHGVTGTVTFNENGDSTKEVIIKQVQGYSFQYVKTISP